MNEGRVAYLLDQLRQRSSVELTMGVLALAGSLTPEMWRALALLHQEQRSQGSDSEPGNTPQTEAVRRLGD